MPSATQEKSAEEQRPDVRHARVVSRIDARRRKAEVPCAAEATLGPTANEWRSSLALIEVWLQADATATTTTTELRDCLAALGRLSQTLHKALALRPERDPMPGAVPGADIGVDDGMSRDRRARHRVSHHDDGALPDRHDFRDRLRLALGRIAAPSSELAVLLVRLEDLDSMAQSFGRRVCEALLRIAGERLQHALRSGDVVRCVADDELACLVANLSAHASLGSLALKLFDAVAAPMVVGAFEFRLRPAIGIATSPANGTTANALLRRADTAMHRARSVHTGFAFFDPTARA